MSEQILHIMLVEASPDDAQRISQLLGKAFDRISVKHCANLAECLQGLRSNACDLILLDLELPDSSGLETYEHVASESQSIPVVILTGLDDENAGIQLIEMGAQDFINKSDLECRLLRKTIQYAIHHQRVEVEYRMNLRRNEALLSINHFNASDEQQLLDFALEKVLEITDSSIGYIYFYNEGARQFILNSWSKHVMEQCRIAQPKTVYDLEKTGIWGEVVRQRRPILVNNFEQHDLFKKGYPEGHVYLSRFLSIPVFDNDRIVAVVGVANKQTPYDQLDELQLTLAMDGVWKTLASFRLQAQIRNASSEWRNTFDSISDSVAIIDSEQHIVRCNKATVDMTGRCYTDIIGHHCYELFHGADEPVQECPVSRAVASGQTESSTMQSGDKWLEVSVTPVFSPDGEYLRAVHIVRDVTEKQNLINSLADISGLFREFMRHTPVYTYIKEVTKDESRVIMASENFIEMVGEVGREMVGKTMHELFPAEFAEKIIRDDWNVVAVGRVMQQDEESNGRHYTTIKFPILQKGRCLVAGFTIDITEKKLSEIRLRDALIKAERFSMALDHVSSYIYIKDRDSRYVYANRATLELFGCDAEDLAGSSDDRFFPAGTVEQLRQIDLRVLSGEQTSEEIIVDHRDGRHRIYLEVKSPMYDLETSSSASGLMGISTDITKIKQSEEALRLMQAKLMQNEKLASIGQLAAGIAHEINNPIGFVYSNLNTLAKYVQKYNLYVEKLEQALREHADTDLAGEVINGRAALKMDYIMQDIGELIDQSCEGVERVKKIVKDMMVFATENSAVSDGVDLNNCLDSTINIVSNEIKYVLNLRRDFALLPKIRCNVQQINQVFMNLLMNAAHSIKESGRQDAGEICVRTWADADNVYVSVSDSGTGISEQNLGRIFDPFFTTKSVGEGVGLGLSVSLEILRKHGGEIQVESEVGKGSTFTVRLPLV